MLLVGLPLLLAGGALWLATQHRDASGSYAAPLSEIHTDGYAVVAADVDALLRQQVPIARAGQTTLRLTAHTGDGPAFVGVAPAADVGRYLADVPHTLVNEVRLARGPLPVAVEQVAGAAEPAVPTEQPFWLLSNDGTGGPLEWTPAELRGQQLALVVMAADGGAPELVEITAQLRPEWLVPTAWGLLGLGTVLLLVAVAAIAWPVRSREVVYVVPPAQVPEIAARLGLPYDRGAGAPAPGAPSTAVPAGWEVPVSGPGMAPATAPAAAPAAAPEQRTPSWLEPDALAPAGVVGEPAPESGGEAAEPPPAWPPAAAAAQTASPTRVPAVAAGTGGDGAAHGAPADHGAPAEQGASAAGVRDS